MVRRRAERPMSGDAVRRFAETVLGDPPGRSHRRAVVDSALLGADIATIPPGVIKKLVAHPLTDKGLAGFMADWEKLQGGK